MNKTHKITNAQIEENRVYSDHFADFVRDQGFSLDSFVCCFRQGGTVNCRWRATVPTTAKIALEQRKETERQGFKAIVKRTGDLIAHGFPIGWHA